VLAYRRHGHLTDKVVDGDWICEMVLWRPWVHSGTATAESQCDLLAIDKETFHTVVKETQTANKVGEEDAIAYAFKAAEVLAAVPMTEMTDLDDDDIFLASEIAAAAFTPNEKDEDTKEEERPSSSFSGGFFRGLVGHINVSLFHQPQGHSGSLRQELQKVEEEPIRRRHSTDVPAGRRNSFTGQPQAGSQKRRRSSAGDAWRGSERRVSLTQELQEMRQRVSTIAVSATTSSTA